MRSYINVERISKMKIKLLILTLILPLGTISAFVSCQKGPLISDDAKVMKTGEALLEETDDAGMSYIDSFIFIGESTTYHLKSRGVLTGGQNTKQVWSTKSGTMTLDLTADKIKIVYPETGEELTFYEATTKKRPEYLMMTFGLNGAVQNIRRGEEYFKTCYKKLINTVRSASPDTKIILQSAFPVAENMDMSTYSVDLRTLNEYIDTINEWTYKIAEEEDCKYLDTNRILKDKNNNLRYEYQSGDGHHLNTEAYRQILYYVRTHAYN